jgi:hypothetical protein
MTHNAFAWKVRIILADGRVLCQTFWSKYFHSIINCKEKEKLSGKLLQD